jgi:putative ABC transport system substrate-binding protein
MGSKHMHRTTPIRLLLVLFVSLSLFLTACGSSQPPRTFKIGIVSALTALEPLVEGFKVGMTEQGYVEGQNVTYLYDKPTSTSNYSAEQLSPQLQKMVEAKVDLIVTVGAPATQAAKNATEGIAVPIVFVPLADPVKSGFVKSLTNPGGNFTGVAVPPEQQGNRLKYLLKVAPDIKRVYIPYDATDTTAELYVKITSDMAGKLGVELVTQPVKNTDEALAAIRTVPENVQAIFTLPSGPLIGNRSKDLVEVSLQKKLPLSMSGLASAEQGVLLAYNVRGDMTGKQAARLVSKILKGATPADTPVETADGYLAINLKTAQAIGLTVPDTVLREAWNIIR